MRSAGAPKRVPQLARPRRLDEYLETVLAGVTGPGDQGRDPGDDALGDPVVVDRGYVQVGQRRDDLDRSRSLDGT